MGDDVAAARATAYDAVSAISWPGMHYRTDIAASVHSAVVKSTISAGITTGNAPNGRSA